MAVNKVRFIQQSTVFHESFNQYEASGNLYSDCDCPLTLPGLLLLANSSQLKFKVLSLGETWEISFVGS